jgi:prolyl oligopeptidase
MQFGLPSLRHDGRWYWSYNSGLQPQSGLSSHIYYCILPAKFTEIVYYRSKDLELPDAVPGPGGEVFFDVRTKASSKVYAPHFPPQPNVLSSDGSVSLSIASYSHDGKWFAYGLSRSVRYSSLLSPCKAISFL